MDLLSRIFGMVGLVLMMASWSCRAIGNRIQLHMYCTGTAKGFAESQKMVAASQLEQNVTCYFASVHAAQVAQLKGFIPA
jgi:hypothetical protein